ncbi:hypothetical protein BZG36_00710 [Bifiguratus adelaidae]|uniref:VPS9 domain-containing protein n=1 Tax=Bifiguratus adelaidae TaxID=1938954 RepID=A0A261Y6S0_9FUNG|nr:hypothetical protein BZG36_00710 [Bifiguratus adelaidae]
MSHDATYPEALWGLDPLFWVHVKLFIVDIYRLKQGDVFNDVYRYGNHNIRHVEVLGLLRGIERSHSVTTYIIDDGTEAIYCVLWRTDPPLFPFGTRLTVQGKITEFRGARQITIHEVGIEKDPNYETYFWLNAIKLKVDVYDKPFIISEHMMHAIREQRLDDANGASRLNLPSTHDINPDSKFKNVVRRLIENQVGGRFYFDELQAWDGIKQAAQACFSENTNVATQNHYQQFAKAIRQLVKEGYLIVIDSEQDLYEVVQDLKNLGPAIVEIMKSAMRTYGIRDAGVRIEFIASKLCEQQMYRSIPRARIDACMSVLLENGIVGSLMSGEKDETEGRPPELKETPQGTKPLTSDDDVAAQQVSPQERKRGPTTNLELQDKSVDMTRKGSETSDLGINLAEDTPPTNGEQDQQFMDIITQFDSVGIGDRDEEATSSAVTPKTESRLSLLSHSQDGRPPMSPTSSRSYSNLSAPPPPPKLSPPKEQIPFDFNLFLQHMRMWQATPILRWFKSFLREFEKRPWSVNEQVKIVQDFLEFIYGKMRENVIWAQASEEEFTNAKEGMEKLVMNRLYPYTYSPKTTDDQERDRILQHKIAIFSWVTEEHLDIPLALRNDDFVEFAGSELLKMNNFKAPRDKLICILNCSKVIYALLREGHTGNEHLNADKFLPVLIYVVLRSNPPQLISNIQYISRFRNEEVLNSEAGYYLTNLAAASSFIEALDSHRLSISRAEFDKQIEERLQELEEVGEIGPEADPRSPVRYDNAIHPIEAANNAQRSLIDKAEVEAFFKKSTSFAERAFQRSVSSVNKIIQDINEGLDSDDESLIQDHSRQQSHAPQGHHYLQPSSAMNPSYNPRRTPQLPPRQSSWDRQSKPQIYPGLMSGNTEGSKHAYATQPALVPAAHVQNAYAKRYQHLQHPRDSNSAEIPVQAPQYQSGPSYPPDLVQLNPNIAVHHFRQSMETLTAMFPNVDKEVCEMILQENRGHLANSIDTLLDMSDPQQPSS